MRHQVIRTAIAAAIALGSFAAVGGTVDAAAPRGPAGATKIERAVDACADPGCIAPLVAGKGIRW